jgi:hypothetical protein
LEELAKEASYPRLAATNDFSHITAALKKLLNDANVNV